MRKYDKPIMIVLGVVLLAAVFFQTQPAVVQAATDYVNSWLRLNTAATTDGKSLRVEFANSVADFNAKTASTATNAPETALTVTHETSGTPANGIGACIDFVQEVTAGNETGARICAEASDVTSGSEDFSLNFYNMAAGAAAAKNASLGSTGIWSLDGAATLDNTTSATELNITETAIQLTGTVNLQGATTVNDDSADVDFIVESNDVADALKVDAGLNVIQHGTWDAYEIVTSTAQSYSLASTGKAGIVIQTAGAAATGHLMTELLTNPGPGAVVTWKTGDSNDITIDTEGSETINGAATYVLDGTYETVTLMTDGTNWHVIGGYLE